MEENLKLQKLFEGVVPERLDEVMSLIQTHNAQFRRVDDKFGFNLDAGAFGSIQFTDRSLEQLWLFGFAGLCALHCYSGIVVLAKSHNLKFDLSEIDKLPDQEDEDLRFSKLIADIEQLRDAGSALDFTWPQGVPKPEDGRPANMELAAVFDLILMATAYVFLHELKHVIFSAEGDTPNDPIEEEMQCDAFASEMMLANIAKYSASSLYPEDKVRMKRTAGIALAAAFIAVITPKANLAGTVSHPPVHKRWSATLGNSELEDNDYYWLYFASLAIAVLKQREIKFPSQIVVSFKRLAISAIEALESGT